MKGKLHSYNVGLLHWGLGLDEQGLWVRRFGRTKLIPIDRINKVGIATSSDDSPGLTRMRWGDEGADFEADGMQFELPGGPAGLVVRFSDGQKDRTLAVTFMPNDRSSMEVVQALLRRLEPDRFVGTGSTPVVRAALGHTGGDMLAGLALAAAIGVVVALLQWCGVLS